MTALQRLEAYLAGLDRRLRFLATVRGLALSLSAALLLTLLLTWIANQYRFASGLVTPLRIILFAGIACVLVFAFIRPLLGIDRRRTARLAENRIPELKQGLLTIAEQKDRDNPFTELIASDALALTGSHPINHFVPTPWLVGLLAAAAAFAVALIWLITSGPGYWGYGASLLWAQSPRTSAPLYDIAVTPGSTTVRRRTDQLIAAQLKGFSAHEVTLHAKYKGALKWDVIPMQAQPSSSGYQILFAGLSDSLEYFVEAGASRSNHFTLAVKDLPAVKHLKVAIHFPAEIKLPDSVEDPGGDIRAVEGSRADIKVQTDKPLRNGVIIMDNGSRIPLVDDADDWLSATLPIKTDGSYHIAEMDGKEAVRMTDDFIIEARKDDAPVVSIVRPGRDAGVSPIEELPVAVTSSDDFGLRSVDLHYSINGGPEQIKELAKSDNSKQVDGKTILALESYKLSPGDLLSFYATAKDGTHTSRSDIVFAKVEPFDLKFQQSQQGGGSGGEGGQQQSEISARQKEIIAATWNQLKDPAKEQGSLAQNARFLSDLESKLSAQAAALAERMNNRELAETSNQFKEFGKSMTDAAEEMSHAVHQLQPGKWIAALGPEQKALQHLLHAESLFRDIQVSFGKQSGSGGGSAGQERDLARMFDLELDTAKNQYESGQTGSPSQDDSKKAMDEQLERLKELARRQQQLASEQHSPQQQFQQKWEEEQLRREAEQLRQQLQRQLAQNSQSQPGNSIPSQSPAGSSQGSTSSGKQQSSAQSRQGRSASAASERNAMRQAMDALSRAENEMRNGSSQPDKSAQQRAADQLTQAQELLRNMQHQRAKDGLSDLAERAKQLSASQSDLGQRVKKMYGAEGINTARSDENGTPVMPEMNGPGYAGGWSRRHLHPIPDQPATREEKSLASEADNLSDKMQQLQSELQAQAQNLAAQQPNATRKIRKALSEAEQAEIAVRMRKGSEWLREGYGSKTWPIQDGITAATERLSRQVEEARQAAANGQDSPDAQGEGTLSQALSQVHSLREQLKAQTQAGQRGGQQQSAVNQLGGLRSKFGSDNRQLSGYFSEAMASLRQMDAQEGLLNARLSDNAMTSLERLEMELARRIGQKADARSGAPENVPEGYRDAVATYFRTLSK